MILKWNTTGIYTVRRFLRSNVFCNLERRIHRHNCHHVLCLLQCQPHFRNLRQQLQVGEFNAPVIVHVRVPHESELLLEDADDLCTCMDCATHYNHLQPMWVRQAHDPISVRVCIKLQLFFADECPQSITHNTGTCEFVDTLLVRRVQQSQCAIVIEVLHTEFAVVRLRMTGIEHAIEPRYKLYG